jgi:hypothetical protein
MTMEHQAYTTVILSSLATGVTFGAIAGWLGHDHWLTDGAIGFGMGIGVSLGVKLFIVVFFTRMPPR